eukprot:6711360-Karenia_brevis.AAC.1
MEDYKKVATGGADLLSRLAELQEQCKAVETLDVAVKDLKAANAFIENSSIAELHGQIADIDARLAAMDAKIAQSSDKMIMQ